MSGKIVILTCANPVSTHWQLGPLPPPAGKITLIGWRLPIRSVDSGVPFEVATILAAALLSISRLNFPVSEARTEGDDEVQYLGNKIAMISTSSLNSAIRLFYDAGFPWYAQGQVGILSTPSARPLAIERPRLKSLISDDWATQVSQLGRGEILGAIRPGVDGDIAGVLSLSDELTHAFLIALENAAHSANVDWMSLSEQAFADGLSS